MSFRQEPRALVMSNTVIYQGQIPVLVGISTHPFGIQERRKLYGRYTVVDKNANVVENGNACMVV